MKIKFLTSLSHIKGEAIDPLKDPEEENYNISI